MITEQITTEIAEVDISIVHGDEEQREAEGSFAKVAWHMSILIDDSGAISLYPLISVATIYWHFLSADGFPDANHRTVQAVITANTSGWAIKSNTELCNIHDQIRPREVELNHKTKILTVKF